MQWASKRLHRDILNTTCKYYNALKQEQLSEFVNKQNKVRERIFKRISYFVMFTKSLSTFIKSLLIT
jgi:hypothetical protein